MTRFSIAYERRHRLVIVAAIVRKPGMRSSKHARKRDRQADGSETKEKIERVS